MKMNHKIIRITAGFLSFSAVLLMSGCQALEKKQQAGAAVELSGHYLYRSTLDSLTLGMNSEDSLRAVQSFIRQWAQDILLYENATAHANEQIEQMVRDYRSTLYAQAYEERLVDKRMPKTIADTTVIMLYEQMPDRFKLEESIMRGVLVIIPKDAPNVSKLKQWLLKVKNNAQLEEDPQAAQALDDIEKYVYQNASGYELFTDKWLTVTEMLSHIPMERSELESKIKSGNRIEVTDAEKTYILQLTDKHMRGEAMPVEYARPEIEKIILNARRVEFLRKERERIYNEAIQEKKIVYFE